MSEIDNLFSDLQALIAEHFGDRLVTVDRYMPEQGGTIRTPAALIDLESFDEGGNDGTGRLTLSVHMAVHCILGFRTPNVDVEVRKFAAEIMWLIGRCPHRFGHPERRSAMPGAFKPGEKDGFEDYVVTFDLTCHLGESAWTGEPWIPQEIYLGHAPLIGKDHEDHYYRVDEAPEETP